MKTRNNGISKVKKFNLDKEDEKTEYEAILNNPKCSVIKDHFAYDKMGRALITVWYIERPTKI